MVRYDITNTKMLLLSFLDALSRLFNVEAVISHTNRSPIQGEKKIVKVHLDRSGEGLFIHVLRHDDQWLGRDMAGRHPGKARR